MFGGVQVDKHNLARDQNQIFVTTTSLKQNHPNNLIFSVGFGGLCKKLHIRLQVWFMYTYLNNGTFSNDNK